MQTFKTVADQVLTAVGQALPTIANEEKHTAASVCLAALYHVEVALNEKKDHLRARQALFSLGPFRGFARKFNNGYNHDLLYSGYTSAVALKVNGIDASQYIDDAVERLGSQLTEGIRRAQDQWVNHCSKSCRRFRHQPSRTDGRWFSSCSKGDDYGSAHRALHDQRMLVKEINDFLQRKPEHGGLHGQPLPNYGSLVIGPNSASAHFGFGGGKCNGREWPVVRDITQIQLSMMLSG